MSKAIRALILSWLFFLPLKSWAWTKLNHQMIYGVTVEIIQNDGGEDARAVKIVLEKNKAIMLKAVVAPDEDKTLWPPIILHANEAMGHYNFTGVGSEGSQKIAEDYYSRAVGKWQSGDMTKALFDLGCVLHLVQDAAFCGHSNVLFFKHLAKHSTFENWVQDQTAPNKQAKSHECLFDEGWAVKSGGFYLKSPWQDDQGLVHWQGEGEAWVDVAAHISHPHIVYSLALDQDDCEFQGQVRQQFVAAECCGAGLLVNFFRQVGLIDQPATIAQRMRQSGLYPNISPNGASRLSLRWDKNKSIIDIEANQSPLSLELPNQDWPALPGRIGHAFYLDNYLIGLVDAAEGDNWKRLYLIPAIPHRDNWWTCRGADQFFFDDLGGLEKQQFEALSLP